MNFLLFILGCLGLMLFASVGEAQFRRSKKTNDHTLFKENKKLIVVAIIYSISIVGLFFSSLTWANIERPVDVVQPYMETVVTMITPDTESHIYTVEGRYGFCGQYDYRVKVLNDQPLIIGDPFSYWGWRDDSSLEYFDSWIYRPVNGAEFSFCLEYK